MGRNILRGACSTQSRRTQLHTAKSARHTREIAALGVLLTRCPRALATAGVVEPGKAVKWSRQLLEIEDTGPGIAPGERHRVLERFYRILRASACTVSF